MAEVTVSVEGVRRSFGSVTALDGVDLDLSGAEVVGVAGPNGSGKTTLIRCLLGLLAPSAGDVRVNGHQAQRLPARERAGLGYMPQREALYHDLTVRENVDFFARLYRLPDRREAVVRALAFVDLRGRAGDRVSTLSGGMQRRASLACAVVHDPPLLVLDEPTVGVDPELRASMWDAFRQWRDAGRLVLVSTHYLGEATRCDRVLLLQDGRVLAFDTPERFLDETGTDDLEDAFLALLRRDLDAPTDATLGAPEEGTP